MVIILIYFVCKRYKLMNNLIYVSNKSKNINQSDFNCILTACNALLPIFCKHWNIICPIVIQSTVNTSNVPPNIMLNLIDSNLTEIPSKNEISVKPILDNGGVVLYKNDNTITVASVVFNELCNLLIDLNLNGWWIDLRSDINNPVFYANEVCDQVQLNIVKITVGNSNAKNGVIVGLCDFILPAWKDPNAKNVQFNYMATLKTPFECSKYGSLIKFTASQGTVEYFGEEMPNWLQNMKKESYKYNFRKNFNK